MLINRVCIDYSRWLKFRNFWLNSMLEKLFHCICAASEAHCIPSFSIDLSQRKSENIPTRVHVLHILCNQRNQFGWNHRWNASCIDRHHRRSNYVYFTANNSINPLASSLDSYDRVSRTMQSLGTSNWWIKRRTEWLVLPFLSDKS